MALKLLSLPHFPTDAAKTARDFCCAVQLRLGAVTITPCRSPVWIQPRTASQTSSPSVFVLLGRSPLRRAGSGSSSMAQDKYMARGRVHIAVADLLDRAVGDE